MWSTTTHGTAASDMVFLWGINITRPLVNGSLRWQCERRPGEDELPSRLSYDPLTAVLPEHASCAECCSGLQAHMCLGALGAYNWSFPLEIPRESALGYARIGDKIRAN